MLDEGELAEEPDDAFEKRCQVKEVGFAAVLERGAGGGEQFAAEALHDLAPVGGHGQERGEVAGIGGAGGVERGEQEEIEAELEDLQEMEGPDA